MENPSRVPPHVHRFIVLTDDFSSRCTIVSLYFCPTMLHSQYHLLKRTVKFPHRCRLIELDLSNGERQTRSGTSSLAFERWREWDRDRFRRFLHPDAAPCMAETRPSERRNRESHLRAAPSPSVKCVGSGETSGEDEAV